MEREELKKKTLEVLQGVYENMKGKIDHAIASGSMNIDAAEDNYVLPRKLMIAILKDAYESNAEWMRHTNGRSAIRDINNIYIQL